MVFSDPDLLQQALTHESYSHEHGLETSTSGGVSRRFGARPDHRPPPLRAVPAAAGRRSDPHEVAGREPQFLAWRRRSRPGRAFILGKGEEASGGRNRPSVLADALEAVIGAIYLNAGLGEARTFVLDLFAPSLGEVGQVGKDYKGELQERTQKHFRGCPTIMSSPKKARRSISTPAASATASC